MHNALDIIRKIDQAKGIVSIIYNYCNKGP
jgi:hypothetical protein